MSEAELWIAGLSAAAAVVPWAFSIHAKVAVIADTVQRMPGMFEELKRTLENHEARLDAHDEEIKTLKSKATLSH